MPLVLGRHEGEKIFLDVGGHRVEIMVVSIRGKCVRLSFKAPDCVKIIREEISDNQPRESTPDPPDCPRCDGGPMSLEDGVWQCLDCGQRKRKL